MNILQLASQYTVSPVYRELFTHMSQIKNTNQTVFLGTRRDSVVDKYLFKEKDNLKFIMKYTHGKIARLLYYPRLFKVYTSIKKSVNLNDIDVIHAHTFFADGGVALIINKLLNKDYIVTVRSTDLVWYMRKMIHAKILTTFIIKKAQKVVFISPGMYLSFKSHLSKKMQEELEKKYEIIPNGIADFWHNNKGNSRKLKNKNNLKIIQVCEQIKRKNVIKSVMAIEKLNEDGINASLQVVGEGQYLNTNINYVKNNNLDNYVKFLGNINGNYNMKKIYNSADIFVMPSENETFGLVYAEALSQGLPIVYTKNTGIYGYFKEGTVGFGVDPNNIIQMVEKIKKITDMYNEMSINAIKESSLFNWDYISKKYYGVYKNE